MIDMVASGAIRAILSTVFWSSSQSSIFTISFHSADFLDDTCMPTLMVESIYSLTPRIFSTFRACPVAMWSMTVPFLMGASFTSFIAFTSIRSRLPILRREEPF